jgi:hypothetical protein
MIMKVTMREYLIDTKTLAFIGYTKAHEASIMDFIHTFDKKGM